MLSYCPRASLADVAAAEVEIQARQLLWKVLGYRSRAFIADVAVREAEIQAGSVSHFFKNYRTCEGQVRVSATMKRIGVLVD